MDAKTKDAINDVRKLARYFESLAQIVASFDELEALDANRAEHERRVAALKEEALRIAAENATAQGIANATLDKAAANAAAIEARAHETAEKAVAEAQTKADEVTAAARAAADAASAEVAKMEDRVQALVIDAELKAKELTGLEAKITKAQQQIAKILGGG